MTKNSLHSPFHGDQKGHMFKIWSHSVWSAKTLLGKEATLASCWAHGGLCISRKELCVESLSFQNTSTSVLCLVTQLCPTLCDPMDCSPSGSSVRGDSPSKNTGVGCHTLLQIFPTQGFQGLDSLPSEPTGKLTDFDTYAILGSTYLDPKHSEKFN